MFYVMLFFMFIWVIEDHHCFELEHMTLVSFFILAFIVFCIVTLISSIREDKNDKKNQK